MENAYIAKASDLAAVADAIRTKGETSGQLVFPGGFVTAIHAIRSGAFPQLIVTAPAGSTITAVHGAEIVTGIIGTEGMLTLDLPVFGVWTVIATRGTETANTSITIEQEHLVALSYSTNVSLHGAPGETICIKADGTEIASVVLDDNGDGDVDVISQGINGKTLTFTGSVSTYTKTVENVSGAHLDVCVYPEGALYWYGREFEDITGGWYLYRNNGATLTKNANNMYIAADNMNSGSAVSIYNAMKIDYDAYSTVHATFSDFDLKNSTYGSHVSLSFRTGLEWNTSSDINSVVHNKAASGDVTISLPIPTNTNKLLVFGFYYTSAKIKKIWME